MAENLVTFSLIDFHQIIDQNYDSNTTTNTTLIRMLKQQFKSKPTIAFSNNFEKIDEILFEDEVFEVRISHCGGGGGGGYSPIIVVLTRSSFVFVDCASREKKCKIKTDGCLYFALEENYDGLGNDALLTTSAESIHKYDLKQFIERKEDCEPLWTCTLKNKASEPVNCMRSLNGERVVVVKELSQIKFINSRTGIDMMHCTSKTLNIPIKFDISGSIEVDYLKPNTIYFLQFSILKQYEYVNGNWLCTEHAIDVSGSDGLFMDRTSGLLYVSSNEGVSVYSTCGELVKRELLSCCGLYIEEKTGLMYIGIENVLTIMR